MLKDLSVTISLAGSTNFRKSRTMKKVFGSHIPLNLACKEFQKKPGGMIALYRSSRTTRTVIYYESCGIDCIIVSIKTIEFFESGQKKEKVVNRRRMIIGDTFIKGSSFDVHYSQNSSIRNSRIVLNLVQINNDKSAEFDVYVTK